MISAIILARCNSSRLPLKHFYKIGEEKIIDITIKNLISNKLIKTIYLATGQKKENLKFKKYLDKKYKKKIKIYFHKNSSNVTERIYFLTKKIKTKYSVLISGDCCLIDNDFIKRQYIQLSKSNKDFIKSKIKLVHEGISTFKTKRWKEVYLNTKKKYQEEHPGYIIKERPNLFKIANYIPVSYEIGKNIRLSVDTESDLDFFNCHYNYLKNQGKKFNLKNILKSKNFNNLNSHVIQKKADSKKDRKIKIITALSKKKGMGHFIRSNVLLREINETYTPRVRLYVLGKKKNFYNSVYGNKIRFLQKITNKLFVEGEKTIIDLPKENLNEIENKILNKKNIIIVDNLKNLKKPKFIIPSIRKFSSINKNIFSGKNFLILSRNILKTKYTNSHLNKDLMILSGSGNLSRFQIDVLKKNTKKMDLILGPLVTKKEKLFLENSNINFYENPDDRYLKIKNSRNVYCKFGVSTFEIIALNKKPIVFTENEKGERMKDINTLFNLGLIKLIKKGKILSNKSQTKIDVNNSLKNVIEIIKSK